MPDVQNLLPTARGYASDYSPNSLAVQTIMPEAVYSAQTLRFATFSPMLVAGTDAKLYRITSGATDISRGTAYTAMTRYEPWRYASFGDYALAVAINNTLQSTATPHTANFADVSGAAPAGTIAVNRGFVMLGRMSSGAFPHMDGWWCCALNDVTDWTPDVATQSARDRLLQTPGPILRLFAFGPYIYAFKGRSLIRGAYTGPPQIWSWTPVSTEIGLAGHDAVCEAEGVMYWLAGDGFYRSAGGAPQRILSAPWEWWMRKGSASINLYDDLTYAQWDPIRRVVRWWYTVDGALYTGGIAYHPDTDRWGRFSAAAECVASKTNEFAGTPDVASALVPEAPIVFTGAHEAMSLHTDVAATRFESGDVGDDDVYSMLRLVRTRFYRAPTTSVATHYYRPTLDATPTTGATAVREDGKYDLAHSARWHRVAFEQTGMVEVGGFSVDAGPAGRR